MRITIPDDMIIPFSTGVFLVIPPKRNHYGDKGTTKIAHTQENEKLFCEGSSIRKDETSVILKKGSYALPPL